MFISFPFLGKKTARVKRREQIIVLMPTSESIKTDFEIGVADAITQCIDHSGVPVFRTRYAGEEIPVMMVCADADEDIEPTYFRNVPEEDRRLMRKNVGDWRPLLKKYGTDSQVEWAMRQDVGYYGKPDVDLMERLKQDLRWQLRRSVGDEDKNLYEVSYVMAGSNINGVIEADSEQEAIRKLENALGKNHFCVYDIDKID